MPYAVAFFEAFGSLGFTYVEKPGEISSMYEVLFCCMLLFISFSLFYVIREFTGFYTEVEPFCSFYASREFHRYLQRGKTKLQRKRACWRIRIGKAAVLE